MRLSELRFVAISGACASLVGDIVVVVVVVVVVDVVVVVGVGVVVVVGDGVVVGIIVVDIGGGVDVGEIMGGVGMCVGSVGRVWVRGGDQESDCDMRYDE